MRALLAVLIALALSGCLEFVEEDYESPGPRPTFPPPGPECGDWQSQPQTGPLQLVTDWSPPIYAGTQPHTFRVGVKQLPPGSHPTAFGLVTVDEIPGEDMPADRTIEWGVSGTGQIEVVGERRAKIATLKIAGPGSYSIYLSLGCYDWIDPETWMHSGTGGASAELSLHWRMNMTLPASQATSTSEINQFEVLDHAMRPYVEVTPAEMAGTVDDARVRIIDPLGFAVNLTQNKPGQFGWEPKPPGWWALEWAGDATTDAPITFELRLHYCRTFRCDELN